jgi:hypothetical protein
MVNGRLKGLGLVFVRLADDNPAAQAYFLVVAALVRQC